MILSDARALKLILPLIAILIFNVAEARTSDKIERLIEKGEYSKAVEKAEKYLAKKPDAPDANDVKSLIVKAKYHIAIKANTFEAYASFLKEYPNSPYQSDVLERQSKIYYESVTKPKGTLETYKEFRKYFPNSSLVPKVMEIEYQLFWEECEAENTVEAWHEYRTTYPDSPRASEAYIREYELFWEECEAQNTVDAWREYRTTYLDSPRASEAYKREYELAWKPLEKLYDIYALEEFYKDYPDSPHASEAKKREENIIEILGASKTGDIEKVKTLLEIDHGLLEIVLLGDSLLHLAVGEGHDHLVEYYVSKGIDVDVRNGRKNTPLHEAVRSRNISITKILINNGADVNAKNKDGETPLHYASIDGYDASVKLLILHGADVNSKNYKKETSLHLASKNGRVGVVKILLSKGADVNSRDEDGNTPLHLCVNSSKEVTAILVANGGDMNIRNRSGYTPQNYEQFAAIAFKMVNRGDSYWLIMPYIRKGNNRINVRDPNGRTLLHIACRRGDYDTVYQFVREGADVNGRDNYGNTPLHSAAQGVGKKYGRLILLLYDERADLNVQNNNGDTPLHIATYNSYFCNDWSDDAMSSPFYILLIIRNANPNIKNKQGKTPLRIAVEEGCNIKQDFIRRRGGR